MALLLEEKEAKLQKLQDRDNFHQGEIAKLNTALQQSEQLHVAYRREVQELKGQVVSTRLDFV